MSTQVKFKLLSGKAIIFTVLILLFLINLSFAQSGWYHVFSDTNAGFGLGGIYFTSANTGYAVGSKLINSILYPRVVKTTNAGGTWNYLDTPLKDSADMYLRWVFFTDENTGFITSAQNKSPIYENGKILKTTNAGINWSVYTPSVNKHLTEIFFVNSLTGFVTGYHTILKTTNAGSSWELSLDAPAGGYLFDIYFLNINTGFVVGNYSWIYKTTNSGNSWTQMQPQGYNQPLWGVWFINNNTGFVVGGDANNTGNNKIFKTTDSGNNWDSVIHPLARGALFLIRFFNSDTGYIPGYDRLLKTTDGGLNWFNQNLPIPEFGANGIFLINATTGYIAGMIQSPYRVGYILKTTTGGEPTGIKPVSNEVPTKFELEQNYPNPFNSMTSIKFKVTSSKFVKLNVFDLLGKEVTTLVNEKLQPGIYEVSFDAGNLPSGTYFYKLTAGEFTDTKRMILIK